jgi:Tol biopolymer transport system component
MLKQIFNVCALLMVTFSAVIASQASTFTVTNKNNSGAGSLRQAIIDAATGDTIDFAPGVRGVIYLNTTRIVVDKNLRIHGPGANVLSLEMDRGDEQRVIHVTSGTVFISGLSITGGSLQLSSTSLPGGSGVLVNSGASLTLNNCMIRKNELSYENSGGQGNGTVQNHGTLTITNSSIVGNLSNNAAGGIVNYGTLTMTNSTVARNTVFVDSSGVGGIHNVSGTATLLNCTISENFGTAGNTGGVLREAGTVNLKNMLIGGNFVNTGTVSSNDINGVFSSQGNNLVENRTGGSGFIVSDLPESNPQIGAVANNGGTTYTVALLTGSPAIDAGNNAGAPATDQRGVARPQSGAVDIGAYESGVKPAAFGKIVFVSDRDGNREIYTMNPDGTGQTRLTFNSAFEGGPRWSPDGTKIVFVSDRDGAGTQRIYVMNADGSNPTLLTPNSFGVGDFDPSWSPDGSKIVFVSTVITSPPTPHIYGIGTMNVDGSNKTGVLGSAVPNAAFDNPIFSQDGSKIIFSHLPNSSPTSDVFSVNLNGTNQTGLTSDNRNNFGAALSPDGNVIAYRRNTNGTGAWRIYLIDLPAGNLPGDDLRPLINPQISQAAFDPAWSPDGTKLIYHTSSSFLGGDLYVRDADGSNPVLLLDQTNPGVGKTIEADWFGKQTPVGSNVTSVSGTVSASFASVTGSGTTTAVPIDPTTAGTLPGGYSFGTGYPAYEITTTASYTAPITVCLHVPNVTTISEFNSLVLFHGENGMLVPVTVSKDFATRTICGSVMTLSPFVVAQNLSPTSASVSVGGRVSNANGRGVYNARVSLTNSNGGTLTALTSPFGYYRFDEIPVGETYFISVSHKRYQFNPQAITVLVEIQNVDFTASQEGVKK